MARVQMREPEAEEQVAPETSDERDTPEPAAEIVGQPAARPDRCRRQADDQARQGARLCHLDELNAVLPSDEVTSEQIEDIMAMLTEMGINVVESEEETENVAAKVETERGRPRTAP